MAEFASKGVANAGLVTGIVGSALGALNSGVGNLLGGNNVQRMITTEDMPVSRYESGIQQQLAAKDSEIGLLKSQVYTDGKLTAVYSDLQGQIKALECEIRRNKDEQTAINMQQAVYNGTNTATIQCIQQQVAQLMGLTALRIPNSSVCPGWGDVTITPSTATTTA